MTQVTTGVRAVLNFPWVYEALQFIVGGTELREVVVNEFVRPFHGARILDIGCGPGEILPLLPPDVVYVGYDVSPDYIARARKRYGDRAAFHATEFNEAELAKHAPFDIALVAGVLHHLSDEGALNLMALLRRAVPSGRVITGDIVVLPNQDFIMRQVVAWDRGRHARSPGGYEDLAHPFFSNVAGRIVRRSVISAWMMECS